MRRIALAVAVVAGSLIAAGSAGARVVVRAPPRDLFCTERLTLGVRYRPATGGRRTFDVAVYISGKRVFHRSGTARSDRWTLFRPRVGEFTGLRFGFTLLRTVYRTYGQQPRRFRTQVLCGE